MNKPRYRVEKLFDLEKWVLRDTEQDCLVAEYGVEALAYLAADCLNKPQRRPLKAFTDSALVSVYTEVLWCQIEPFLALVRHLSGERELRPGICKELKPDLEEQFPWLRELGQLLSPTAGHRVIEHWFSELKARVGSVHHVLGKGQGAWQSMIINYRGKRLREKPSPRGSCRGCYFLGRKGSTGYDECFSTADSPNCCSETRDDGQDVIFVQVGWLERLRTWIKGRQDAERPVTEEEYTSIEVEGLFENKATIKVTQPDGTVVMEDFPR